MLISKSQSPTKFNNSTPLSQKQQEQPVTKTIVPPNHSTCLLLILNNCSFTKDVILPQIQQSLTKLGFPDMTDAVGIARQAVNVTFNPYDFNFLSLIV